MLRVKRRAFWALAAAAAAALIAVLTLSPIAGAASLPAPTCLLCGDHGLADAVANVLLFAPLGALLVLTGLSVRQALLAGLVFSTGIEFLQLALPGRSPTFRDIALNAFGAWLAATLIAGRGSCLAPPRHRLRSLAYASAGIPAVVVCLSAWLLAPTSTSDPWYGLWHPELRNFTPWDGRVLSATIGREPVPGGRLENVDFIRAALVSRQPIGLDLQAGTPTSGLGAIFAIFDSRQREILLVGVRGESLIISERRRATWLRFDQPVARFPAFFSGTDAGDSLSVLIALTDEGACVTAARRQRCDSPISAGSVWTLVAWQGGWLSGSMGALLNAVTLGLLVIPVAFYSARAWRIGAALLALAALLFTSLEPIGIAWSAADAAGVAAGLLIGTSAGATDSLRARFRRVILRTRNRSPLGTVRSSRYYDQ